MLRTKNGSLIDFGEVLSPASRSSSFLSTHGGLAAVPADWAWLAFAGNLRLLPAAVGKESQGLRGGARMIATESGRANRFRGRLQVLRRSAGRKPRKPVDSARHHQPGWAQRLRQDHIDEPDDWLGSAHARAHQRAGHIAPTNPSVCFTRSVTARSSTHSPKGSRATSSFTLICGSSDTRMPRAARLAEQAIERVSLTEAAAPPDRGVQQRHAPAHQAGPGNVPQTLRTRAGRTAERPGPIDSRRDHRPVPQPGQEGLHVIISSHVLHEVDAISDQVCSSATAT